MLSGESGTYVLHVSMYVCGGRYQCVHWYQDCTLTRSSYAVQIILVSGHSHLQCESCTSTMVGTACSQGYKYWVSVMKSTPVFRHWLGLEALIVKAVRAWTKCGIPLFKSSVTVVQRSFSRIEILCNTCTFTHFSYSFIWVWPLTQLWAEIWWAFASLACDFKWF